MDTLGVTLLAPIPEILALMNRTERLYAIGESLRRANGTGTSAATLAITLEVSERTIKRDITALQEAGSPIWSQRGPGGGYVLDDSATLPPIAFTPSQAAAIATAVAMLPLDTPFAVDARTASRKLVDTLADPARTQTALLAERIWLLSDSHRRTHPSVVRAIERSLVQHTVLSITYANADDETSQRLLEPIISAWTTGAWYLVAHCQTRNDVRWFRFDRIERARNTTTHYHPHPTADAGTPPQRASAVNHE